MEKRDEESDNRRGKEALSGPSLRLKYESLSVGSKFGDDVGSICP
jgi:hypothetical protein